MGALNPLAIKISNAQEPGGKRDEPVGTRIAQNTLGVNKSDKN